MGNSFLSNCLNLELLWLPSRKTVSLVNPRKHLHHNKSLLSLHLNHTFSHGIPNSSFVGQWLSSSQGHYSFMCPSYILFRFVFDDIPSRIDPIQGLHPHWYRILLLFTVACAPLLLNQPWVQCVSSSRRVINGYLVYRGIIPRPTRFLLLLDSHCERILQCLIHQRLKTISHRVCSLYCCFVLRAGTMSSGATLFSICYNWWHSRPRATSVIIIPPLRGGKTGRPGTG